MRIKVVDVFTDGNVECLHDGRYYPFRDDCIKVSQYELLRAIGITEPWKVPSKEVFDYLKGKEFDITPIVGMVIPGDVKLQSQNKWTYHEIPCSHCFTQYCVCGENYEPYEE